MIYDGEDLKYLLGKKDYTLTDVARELGVTTQAVSVVVAGKERSRRVIAKIERILDLPKGSLEVSRERRTALVRVA